MVLSSAESFLCLTIMVKPMIAMATTTTTKKAISLMAKETRPMVAAGGM